MYEMLYHLMLHVLQNPSNSNSSSMGTEIRLRVHEKENGLSINKYSQKTIYSIPVRG